MCVCVRPAKTIDCSFGNYCYLINCTTHADISEITAQIEGPTPVLHSVGDHHQED